MIQWCTRLTLSLHREGRKQQARPIGMTPNQPANKDIAGICILGGLWKQASNPIQHSPTSAMLNARASCSCSSSLSTSSPLMLRDLSARLCAVQDMKILRCESTGELSSLTYMVAMEVTF